MGKSTNGPEMTDVSATWWQFEQLHQCSITMLVELDGSTGGCGLYVSAVAVQKRPVRLEEAGIGSATIRFPHRDHRTFEGALLKLLYQLDYLAGQLEASERK